MQVFANLNLNGNEIQNVLVHMLAADPGSPAEGQVWYNTTDEVLRYYNGTATIDLDGTAASMAAEDVTIADVAGDFTATNVEDALAELQSDAEADATALADHIADATAAHAGTAISNTPAGGIAATTVQAAINELDTEKAPLASPALTGNPTAPTPATADNDTSIATTAHVHAVVAALVDAAPGTLDTLNELAAALGDDPNFAATIAADLATKTEKSTGLIGDGVVKTFTYNHALGTQHVIVQVYEVATLELVEVDIEHVDANNVEINFSGPTPGVNAFRVIVIG